MSIGRDITVQTLERVVARLLSPEIPESWKVVLHALPGEELAPDTVAVAVEETTTPPGYDPPILNALRHALAVTVYGDRCEACEELAATLHRVLLTATPSQWLAAAEAVSLETDPEGGADSLEVLWQEPEESRTESSYDGAALSITIRHATVTATLMEESAP